LALETIFLNDVGHFAIVAYIKSGSWPTGWEAMG